jgi:2-oxoglutarate ferredoxin oxidoreductase subunit gamma
MRHEVRLAGFGGQGIILAGFVLGRAAAIYGGKEAVFTQSYGPEARGGACAAEVVISDEPIDYPLLTAPTHVVCMSQEAFNKYGSGLADGASLITDSDLVQVPGLNGTLRSVPATRLARELGNRMAANIVMLGFFAGATGVVSRQALEEAVRASMKPKLLELNMRALDAGFQEARDAPVAGLKGAKV